MREDFRQGLADLPFPPSPPPAVTPSYIKTSDTSNMDMLKNCIRRYIYIWKTTGDGFWMYPTEITLDILRGYTWTGSRWSFSKLTLSQIDSFYS